MADSTVLLMRRGSVFFVMAKRKKEASQMFTINEWLEALLRCRDEQPIRYAREVSAGTRARVERYAEQKALQSSRPRRISVADARRMAFGVSDKAQKRQITYADEEAARGTAT